MRQQNQVTLLTVWWQNQTKALLLAMDLVRFVTTQSKELLGFAMTRHTSCQILKLQEWAATES